MPFAVSQLVKYALEPEIFAAVSRNEIRLLKLKLDLI